MGVVALDMDLDSAIRILNYRLSTCTSDVASDIFRYRIALLTKKVMKTQKKVVDSATPGLESITRMLTGLLERLH